MTYLQTSATVTATPLSLLSRVERESEDEGLTRLQSDDESQTSFYES
jgi:hypothetical protein